MKKRFSDEQIISILREAEAAKGTAQAKILHDANEFFLGSQAKKGRSVLAPMPMVGRSPVS